MKILSFKKLKGSKYKVTLEDNTSINLYENLILKENLLLTKEIEDLEEIERKNKDYSIKEKALSYISYKQRSVRELRSHLKSKGYEDTKIEDTINYLLKNNYLNDDNYAKSFINDQVLLTNNGPKKIIKELEKNNINPEEYIDYIYSKLDIEERIRKYVEKNLKTNKKSNLQFKQKMLINLINLGYDKESIERVLNTYKVDEESNYEKEYLKLKKKYQNKVEESQLDYFIRNKLYQKGYKNRDY